MTEIPEHLLRRSRERRAALGLPTEGGAEGEPTAAESAAPGGSSAPATTAAAPAPAAAPAARAPAAPSAPPPPKPDPPYVAAAKARHKIPFWAMPVLALLPLWAIMYALAMRPQEAELSGPLAEGAEIYTQCASCHGPTGGGGIGYPFADGEVLLTFPDIEQHVDFVSTGSQIHAGQPYGDPARPGGPHVGLARNGSAMPAFGPSLTQAELIAVVCHERYTLGGGDQTGDEFLEWCAPDAPRFVEAEAAG